MFCELGHRTAITSLVIVRDGMDDVRRAAGRGADEALNGGTFHRGLPNE